MTLQFKRIGVLARHQSPEVTQTFACLLTYLESQSLSVFSDAESLAPLTHQKGSILPREMLGQQVDVVIVVGGDGSMLSAARLLVATKTPIIGVNRGRLGFLTDVKPQLLIEQISEILQGKYHREERFLLEAELQSSGIKCAALNDIVLHIGSTAHMMEFDLYVNDEFMYTERADGLILATPTGSTAYALSGGGPILHPGVDAVVLVPMFSHTLNSRPIVLHSHSRFRIVMKQVPESPAHLSADAERVSNLSTGDVIVVAQKPEKLTLLHPLSYNYYETLCSKLDWGRRVY